MMKSPLDVRSRLAGAIEALYLEFSSYPLAPRVEGCPCCVSADDEALLRSKPLMRLTALDLHRYATKAMTTWGAAEDFKHFLPRLFELVTAEESITSEMDEGTLFGKLTYAKWREWPQREQQVVTDYLDALWPYLLSLSPQSVTLNDYLCIYVELVDDLTPYLEAWAETRTAFSLGHYLDFLSQNELGLSKRDLGRSWSWRGEQMQQVIDWATSPATGDMMGEMLYL